MPKSRLKYKVKIRTSGGLKTMVVDRAKNPRQAARIGVRRMERSSPSSVHVEREGRGWDYKVKVTSQSRGRRNYRIVPSQVQKAKQMAKKMKHGVERGVKKAKKELKI